MELWTLSHAKSLIPAVLIFAAMTVVLYLQLRNKDIRLRMIPLQVIAVLIVALEILKQINSARGGSYDLYSIPLHFCSLFIFTTPAMAFYRGKYENAVRNVGTVVAGAITLLFLIYPNLIYPASAVDSFFDSFGSFHTVVFHSLVVLACFLIFALRLYGEAEKSEWGVHMIFIAIYSVIAGVMAQVLKTNYANMYHCNVPPIEELRVSLQGILGYWPTQILWVLTITVGQLLFVSLIYLICRLVRYLVSKASKPAEA